MFALLSFDTHRVTAYLVFLFDYWALHHGVVVLDMVLVMRQDTVIDSFHELFSSQAFMRMVFFYFKELLLLVDLLLYVNAVVIHLR